MWHRSTALALFTSGIAFGSLGCEDPVVVGGQGGDAPAAPAPAQPAPAQPSAAGDDGAQAAPGGAPPAAEAPPEAPEEPAGPTYSDEDFVEALVANRDPFRGFAHVFVVRPVAEVQREVIMPNVAIEEMHLIAIITGMPEPRAMLTDPANVGFVIKRGDFIGRSEVVQTGGAEGIPVVLNWRVDRIRENEVVLTREDPTAPDRPPLSRVIPLRQVEPNPLLEQLRERGRL